MVAKLGTVIILYLIDCVYVCVCFVCVFEIPKCINEYIWRVIRY